MSSGTLQPRDHPGDFPTLTDYLHSRCNVPLDATVRTDAMLAELHVDRAYRRVVRGKFSLWFLVEFCRSVYEECTRLLFLFGAPPKMHVSILMHPLICKHQITPKTSRYTRCSMSMFPNAFINGTNPVLGPIGEMVVQHQPLAKQRMRPPLHRVRLQPAVITDALARRTQQRQNGDRQRADQQQAVPPVRARNMDRRESHPEAHVLDVPKARLNPPALAVVPNQDPRRDCLFRWPPGTTVRPSSDPVRTRPRRPAARTRRSPEHPPTAAHAPRRRPTRRPLAARPAHSSHRCLHAAESRIRRPAPSVNA